jgi:T5orf172 domain
MWTNEDYDNYLFEIESPLYRIDDYKGNKVKINHECINGHITHITPLDVKNKKSDCSQCSGAKHSLQSFNESLKAQGSEYTCIEYNTGKEFCAFLCPKCNNTWKTRSDNISSAKSGCPTCAKRGYKVNKPGTLYYIKIKNYHKEIYYKIGITNNTLEERFRLDKDKIITTLIWKTYTNGNRAKKLEQYLLKRYKHLRVNVPDFLNNGGNTELFKEDILNKDIDKEP